MRNENNVVNISGTIITDLSFSHETFRENFYEGMLSCKRISGVEDKIPVIFSDRLELPKKGDIVQISGSFRSYNQHLEDGKSRLLLQVFAEQLFFVDVQDCNCIELKGFLCKEPVYRKTPFGREVCDLVVAVNRDYGKSDYIPCIAWGRNAVFASRMTVGDEIFLAGRIQSREYEKLVNGLRVIRTAREVSIYRLELLGGKES